MLTLFGPKSRYCDGLSRRSFLRIGGLAVGGLGLPGLLRAEQQAGIRKSHKAVIMVYLSGGLAHQDTFDLKPAAPAEVLSAGGCRYQWARTLVAMSGAERARGHVELAAMGATVMAWPPG